jgi:hypothetical protein
VGQVGTNSGEQGTTMVAIDTQRRITAMAMTTRPVARPRSRPAQVEGNVPACGIRPTTLRKNREAF